MGETMNAIRLVRAAPYATRSFKTSAPAQGFVSTVGSLGIAGILIGPGIPPVGALVEKHLAKDEYKTLTWLGGMFLFGFMASCGGKKAPAAGGDDFDFDAFMKEVEASDK